MKVGSLKEGGRDGTLIVVSRDLTRAVRATGIAWVFAPTVAISAKLEQPAPLHRSIRNPVSLFA